MSVSTAVPTIERPKVGRPRKDIDTESVRLWSEVVRKARTVVVRRKEREPGLTLGDYLSKHLVSAVDRDYKAEKKRWNEEE